MESTRSKSAILANSAVFLRLKDLVIKETGLAYYQQKDEDLAERLARRLEALNIPSSTEYLQLLLLTNGRVELDLLIGELTIGETYFFRHKEQFDVLKNAVIPDLIKKNSGRKSLRIWSAGASIGAEAYSVAILLKQDFGAELAGWNIEIVGTDINRAFLATATVGTFPMWALRSITDGMKASCFDPVKEGTNAWRLKDEYRKHVRFQYHNLCTTPFPSYESGLAAFDIILCRNVMIYFDQPTVQRLLNQFSQSLTADGWLLIGSSEINAAQLPGLKLHQYAGASAYQKTTDAPLAAFAPVSFAPLPLAPMLPSVGVYNAPAKRSGEPESKSTPAPRLAKTTHIPAELTSIRDLADRGALKEALERCESLIAVAPIEAAAHFLQGLICAQLSQDAASESAFRSVIYLDRKFVLAHYHLGMLLRRKGNYAKSEQFINNALRLLSELPPSHLLEEGHGMQVQDLSAILNSLGARAS